MKKILDMKKLLLTMLVMVMPLFCSAQERRSVPLDKATVETVLEFALTKYYPSWFNLREYIPKTIIIKSIGIDQVSGGTHVTGIHDYQGLYVPIRGSKTHKNVAFEAVFIRYPDGVNLTFTKEIPRGILHPMGGKETGSTFIKF